jgi:hypothetical protein
MTPTPTGLLPCAATALSPLASGVKTIPPYSQVRTEGPGVLRMSESLRQRSTLRRKEEETEAGHMGTNVEARGLFVVS